jgi:cytochrome c peroxidase
MEFITRYANPVSIGISDLEKKLKIKVIRYNRLLNQDAKTLFDSNAFNVNAYAPDHSGFITDEKIVLGKKLFEDPVLSGTGKRSCRSCHQPALAFTDGMAKNTIIGEKELLDRNTPTLVNAALQPSLFYDLRVNSLEEQSHTVVQSAREMHGSMVLSVNKLGQDSIYRKMFIAAFPHENKNLIDTFEVMNAIGSYIRSLVLLNSRFDEYMRGRQSAMDTAEINGFNLFMGKARCATCHYMPLFNGSFPPVYRKNEVEVIGVPKSRSQNEIDPDMGRYDIVKVESVKHAFKISTVRNAARTAPYMHNGVYATLEQVMDFYNKGGGAGLGIKLRNQTLPADKLNLTEKEIGEVIAFIKSLDSKLPVN